MIQMHEQIRAFDYDPKCVEPMIKYETDKILEYEVKKLVDNENATQKRNTK